MNKSSAETVYSRWHWLYKIGGAAALFSLALIPIQLIIFITWPPPDTASGWFTLFQDNVLRGLLSFELLFVVNAILGITTTLALYIALRRANESFMAIALALGLVGTMAIIAARPVFEMLTLSQQYAAATTDAQRTMFLAAGEMMLAVFNGTAFHVSYNLANINLLIIPVVMLQSKRFSKTTAAMGILAGSIGFGLYIPKIGIFISIFSVLFYAIWYILIARTLFQLGQGKLDATVHKE